MNSYGAKQKSRLLIYMFIYINAKNYNKVIEKSRAQDLKEMLKKIFSLVIQSAFFMTRVFLVLFMFFFFFLFWLSIRQPPVVTFAVGLLAASSPHCLYECE